MMIPAISPYRSLLPLMLLLFFCIACLVCLASCDAGEDGLLPATPSPVLPEGTVDDEEPVAINVSVDNTDELFGDVQTREALRSVRFRLMAYKNNSISTANYAGTAVFSVDNYGTVNVVSGTASPANSVGQLLLLPGKYAFVLYCYNTNSNPSMLSSYVTRTVYHNEDFMVCNRTGVAVGANSTGTFILENITFTRLCARLQLAVTAEGFPIADKITSCAATISGLSNNSATWTAGTSSLSVYGSGSSLSVNWDSPSSSSVYSKYLSVLPQSSRNVAVKFTSLVIDGSSYVDKVKVNVANQGYNAGGSYQITVRIEKELVWAPGNLVKNGDKYSFVNDEKEYGSYFGWNTLNEAKAGTVPSYNAGEYKEANDPCSKVEPAGTWVTPTKRQLQTLKKSGGGLASGGIRFGGKYSDVYFPWGGYIHNQLNFVVNAGYRGSYGSKTLSDTHGYELYINENGKAYDSTYPFYYGTSIRCIKK